MKCRIQKFDYSTNEYYYLYGEVIKAERTLCTHYDPVGDTLYTVKFENGTTAKLTSGLVEMI